VLTQMLAVLGPLKLVVAGILFFNLAWIAVRKLLVLGVVGLSVGETSLPHLWAQVQHLGHSAAAGVPAHGTYHIVYLLIANALLATAIWFAVRSLKLWARATIKQREEEFWDMVRRDEREWRGVAPARLPGAPGGAPVPGPQSR
jgi:hypothetical protein